MLLSFTCSNFRSIKEEQTISFIAGPTQNLENQIIDDCNLKVLKGTVIFGGNAAGKSNFYKAIRYSRDIIVKIKPDYNRQNYFIFDKNYKNKPTLFEYEISVNDKIFRYGFEINLKDNIIESEKLTQLLPNSDVVIFDRNKDLVKFDNRELDFDEFNGELFIHNARRSKYKNDTGVRKTIWEVWNWFYESLAVLGPTASLLWDYDLGGKNGEKELKKITEVISRFDTGIVGYKFEKHDLEFDEPLKLIDNSRQLYSKEIIKCESAIVKKSENGISAFRFIHDNDTTIRLDQESDGTLRLFKLSPILTRDDKDCTYIVDEFDRGLHPSVVKGFVDWFLRKNFKHKKQLIVTTHNAILLDQNLIRRDEIWFVEKNEDGSSEIFSLDDYKIRFDKNIYNAYFEGRFKGVPNINLPEDI